MLILITQAALEYRLLASCLFWPAVEARQQHSARQDQANTLILRHRWEQHLSVSAVQHHVAVSSSIMMEA